MKKTVLIIAFLLVSLCGFTQTKIGAQLSYGTETELGVGAKGSFKITDEIHASPSINYFFGESAKGISSFVLSVNLDGHYLFPIDKAMAFYPLAGLNFTRVSATVSSLGVSETVSKNKFGLNLGGGFNYEFTPSIVGVAEIKYVVSEFDQAVFSVGAMFKL